MSEDQERGSSSDILVVADWVKRLPYGQQFIGGLVLVLMILAGWVLMSDLGTVARTLLAGLIIVAIIIVLVVATYAFILPVGRPYRLIYGRGGCRPRRRMSNLKGVECRLYLTYQAARDRLLGL